MSVAGTSNRNNLTDTGKQAVTDVVTVDAYYKGNSPKLWAAGRAVTIFTSMLREKLSSAVARERADVPGKAAAITREWLTDVLCWDHPSALVAEFEITDGTSQTTERAAIRVEYNAAGQAALLPTRLFAKFTPRFSQRLMTGAAGMMYGEGIFYSQFRPAIEKLESPYGYWGRVDPRSWRSVVLMEDIAVTRGATFPDPARRFNREELEDLVDAMAAYHGTWWQSPKLAMLKTTADHLRLVSGFADMGKRCLVGLERAGDVIPPAIRDAGDRLWHGTKIALSTGPKQHPNTLLHGDAHVAQTYKTGNGHMGICDWASIMAGCWGYDYADLIGSACEPEDRRLWERDLLSRYLDKLKERGADAPNFDEAWLIYRQNMAYPCTAWAFAHGRASYQPEMQPDHICRPVLRRLAIAVEDLETFKSLGV